MPKLTPQARREAFARAAAQTNESDDDTLVLQADFDFGDIKRINRGQFLHQSTLKPTEPAVATVASPDPIPNNCVPNTKRIVRIVKNQTPSGKSVSCGIQAKPKSVSIGVQVNEVCFIQPKVNFVAPATSPSTIAPIIEQPLRSYWTHKVNLPYPPEQLPIVQNRVNQLHKQQRFELQQLQQQHQYQLSLQQQNYEQQISTAYTVSPSHGQPGPSINPRRMRRNFVKSQKHKERQAIHRQQAQSTQFWPPNNSHLF